jgi:two-component system, NarL family, invasion response regulator UvrY
VLVNEIANRLYLSPKTVHSYRSRIFEKLGVENDVALTLMAIREGIIALDEAGG